MPEPTPRPADVPDYDPAVGRTNPMTAPPPEFVSSIPPHQQAGYDAVYEVIRATPGDAWRNALIWRAVEAYRTASESAALTAARDETASAIALLRELTDPDLCRCFGLDACAHERATEFLAALDRPADPPAKETP